MCSALALLHILLYTASESIDMGVRKKALCKIQYWRCAILKSIKIINLTLRDNQARVRILLHLVFVPWGWGDFGGPIFGPDRHNRHPLDWIPFLSSIGPKILKLEFKIFEVLLHLGRHDTIQNNYIFQWSNKRIGQFYSILGFLAS